MCRMTRLMELCFDLKLFQNYGSDLELFYGLSSCSGYLWYVSMSRINCDIQHVFGARRDQSS